MNVRKADLNGYILVLMGLQFVFINWMTLRETEANMAAVGGTVLGFLAVGLGIYERRNPLYETQTEPAPTYLYVFAAIATVAFVAVVWARVI
ncbi:hypothetical protein SAMN04487950_1484 [Halogranum rubrum]|uniref:Uncharacterized protein n=1 Tax=Halogranum rubrum TaxID=553466 RepID=A0A1I4CZD7_9EURY|nr:hypothetical protein [Halogranum rubrum]SFK85980.1 hypothetical protein SAMN04487950_1484 [Halogranum rubrum]